jgi:hypothetical protein
MSTNLHPQSLKENKKGSVPASETKRERQKIHRERERERVTAP